MKTDNLIQTLSADTHRAAPVDRLLPPVLVAATLLFGGSYLAIAGVRPDLATALQHINVVIKQGFPALLALGGLGFTLRLSRPGASYGPWPWLMLVVPGAILATMAAQLVILPPEIWPAAVRGTSRATCLTMIPLISTPIAAVAFWTLRRGAPTHPHLCGAIAGFMSGGAGATAYAFFCTDDNPLFYGTWYSAGILIVALAGFVIGGRILRW